MEVCIQCTKMFKSSARTLTKGKIHFCCQRCFEAYQEKKKDMRYRNYTITAKMIISPPDGSQWEYDMPPSLVRPDAVKKIDELLSVKCAHCNSVIKPGKLYVESVSSYRRLCSLKCYEEENPGMVRDEATTPTIRRLDSASVED